MYADQTMVCILTVDGLNKVIPIVKEVTANCLGQTPSSRIEFNFNRVQTDSGSVSSEVDLQRNCMALWECLYICTKRTILICSYYDSDPQQNAPSKVVLHNLMDYKYQNGTRWNN